MIVLEKLYTMILFQSYSSFIRCPYGLPVLFCESSVQYNETPLQKKSTKNSATFYSFLKLFRIRKKD